MAFSNLQNYRIFTEFTDKKNLTGASNSNLQNYRIFTEFTDKKFSEDKKNQARRNVSPLLGWV
jgi:hypothetical protein